MDEDLISRLSRINTSWEMLRQAHEGGQSATIAQQLLIERYGPAVRRYLLAGLRDVDAADELLQEFSLSLVRSDFRGVDPARGRFRDYVKTVLFHSVSNYRRRLRKLPLSLTPELVSAVPEANNPPAAEDELRFRESWRETLLVRVWEALADANASYHGALRYRAEHPTATSERLAAELSRASGKSISAATVRQTIHRARALFARLLVDEVAHSLSSPTLENLEEELLELDLVKYCREALQQRR